MRTKNIERFLKSFGKEVVRKAKSNLSSAGKGGGNLERSIDFKVVDNEGSLDVEFYMADYGPFQDKGVKGAGGKIGKKSYGGRRHYITWEGKRKDSPYKFGSGTGQKGGLKTGMGKFIRKKGLQPRSEGGQFMSTKSLIFLFSRSIYIRGIHGVSFFQNSLRLGMEDFAEKYGKALTEDIINAIGVENNLSNPKL